MTSLVTQTYGDVFAVRIREGKILDEAKIQELGRELIAVVDKVESKLLLNFEDVKFMSSGMLGKLILLNKKCKTDNVALKMCNISPDIMEVFRLMRLNKVLDIYADETKAMRAFEKMKKFA